MLYVDQRSFFIAAFEFFGAMMCMIAIVIDMGHAKHEIKREVNLVRLILGFSMLSLLTDGGAYLLDLNAYVNAILINKIILFVDFIAYLSAFLALYLFVIAQLPNEKQTLKRTLGIIVTGLIGLDYLMLLLNPFTSIVYYVDKNNEYFDNWGLSVFTGILFVCSFALIIAFLVCRKLLEKSDYIPIILSMCMLIIGGASELVIDDFPGTNIGIGFAVLFIYWVYKMKLMKQNSQSNNHRYMLFVMYLFLGMTFCVFCTFVINVSTIVDMTKETSKRTSEIVANVINESVENVFVKPITVSDTMSQSANLKNAIINDAETDLEEVNQDLVDYLASIRDGMNYQMVFAVSDLNKKFYTYDGISKIVDPVNDSHDIWYSEFLETGKNYTLTVDTDEANDWSLSVFVNTRVKDEKGKLIAVCGIGVSMVTLQNMISQFEREYGVQIYLTDSDGLVKVAANGEDIESLQLDNDYFKKVKEKEFYYERMESSCRLTKYDGSLGWYIVIVDNKPDKFSVSKVVRPGLLAAFISVLLMLFAYVGMNRYNNRMSRVLAENKKNTDSLKKISETDELTGIFNRHAYEEEKRKLDMSEMPEDFLVLIMDINGLKGVNDNIGHDAGDELIIGAANCINKVFAPYGNSYRIGGDEFASILFITKDELADVVMRLREATGKWNGVLVKELAISVGYAYHADYPEFTFNQLVKLADEAMYDDKREYYRKRGIDRRGNGKN